MANTMVGRICLVTGANGGIGKALSSGLARMGAAVVMMCRDEGRGKEALAEVKKSSGNEHVELLLCDLASLVSVRKAADEFMRRFRNLHVLVNNAGVYSGTRKTTADGFELMFGVNHLGPFLLTNLLLDRLKSSAPSRVVCISAPSTSAMKFDDLQSEKKFSAFGAFGMSKAADLYFTFELAKRLHESGVTANALHPGLVQSTLMNDLPAPARGLLNFISAKPEQGVSNAVYVSTAAELEKASGKFFVKMKEAKLPKGSENGEARARLWQESARLVGLK